MYGVRNNEKVLNLFNGKVSNDNKKLNISYNQSRNLLTKKKRTIKELNKTNQIIQKNKKTSETNNDQIKNYFNIDKKKISKSFITNKNNSNIKYGHNKFCSNEIFKNSSNHDIDLSLNLVHEDTLYYNSNQIKLIDNLNNNNLFNDNYNYEFTLNDISLYKSYNLEMNDNKFRIFENHPTLNKVDTIKYSNNFCLSNLYCDFELESPIDFLSDLKKDCF